MPWFIGFTADYVVGVWMGYDDNTPLAGVTGGGLPAEIWKEVMLKVDEGVPPSPLPVAQPESWRVAPITPAPTQNTGNDPIGRLFARDFRRPFKLSDLPCQPSARRSSISASMLPGGGRAWRRFRCARS